MISNMIAKSIDSTMSTIAYTAEHALTDLDNDQNTEASVAALRLLLDATVAAAKTMYPSIGVDSAIKRVNTAANSGLSSDSEGTWKRYQKASLYLDRLSALYGPRDR